MRGKKALLAKCLFASGATSALAMARAALVRDLPILTYHRIWDIDNEDQYPYDLELVSASTDDFRWQMEYVKRYFTPITFATLGRILDGEQQFPRRPIIVTFDDGFEDNYRLAFPILKSLNVPATMFVSTDYIGTNTTYWFDQLAHLLMTAPVGRLEVVGLEGGLELSDVASRRVAAAKLLEHTKHISNASRLAIIADLHRQLNLDESCSATDFSRPMTWDNVREMAAGGIEIGSHTVRHPILTRLPVDELRTELVESKRRIESEVGRPVTVLSYPVGQSYAFNAEVCEATRQAGYRFAAAFVFGNNRFANLDLFALKRLSIERTIDRPNFAALLQLPELLA